MNSLTDCKKVFFVFIFIGGSFTACLPDEKDNVEYKQTSSPIDSGEVWDIDYNKIYYCPFHKDKIDIHPRKCPVCGTWMILKPRKDSLDLNGNETQ